MHFFFLLQNSLFLFLHGINIGEPIPDTEIQILGFPTWVQISADLSQHIYTKGKPSLWWFFSVDFCAFVAGLFYDSKM